MFQAAIGAIIRRNRQKSKMKIEESAEKCYCRNYRVGISRRN
jgi:hypothetical protein